MLIRLRRLWVCFASLFAALYLAITFTPFVDWYAAKLAGQWSERDGGALVVLAGGDLGGGFPSENTMLRCYYGALGWRTGRFRSVVVSGFQTSREMREVLVSHGIPPAVIAVEDRSRSTRENAVNTATLLRGGANVLLTSDYHMFRAVRAFRKAGVAVRPWPVPDARKRAQWRHRRWTVFQDEAAETVKIVYYFVRGWI